MSFENVLIYIKEFLSIDSVWDVFRVIIDVGIVAYVVYKLLISAKDSRAFQVLKGLGIVTALYFVAEWLNLVTVSYIIKAFFGILPIILVILFQPEIRRWLETMGSNRFSGILKGDSSASEQLDSMIREVVIACSAMASERVGALIIFERETSLGEIVRTGTKVDSLVTERLLRLIFIPNTPLHDGAIIIKNFRVEAAACYLPLSSNLSIDKDLGTRHRAGVGITENTDCIAIIVSEETGKISVSEHGVLTRGVSNEELRNILLAGLDRNNGKTKHRLSSILRKESHNGKKKQ